MLPAHEEEVEVEADEHDEQEGDDGAHHNTDHDPVGVRTISYACYEKMESHLFSKRIDYTYVTSASATVTVGIWGTADG